METVLFLEAKKHISKMITVEKRYKEEGFPLHWHNFFEIEIILSGKGSQNLNGTVYPLKAGTAYIVTPADFHDLRVEEPIEMFNIMFDESILSDDFAAVLLERKKDVVVNLSERALEKTAFTAEMLLDEYNDNAVFRDKYIRNLIESLFFLLMREYRAEYTVSTPHGLSIKKALLYMHMHFRDNPSLRTVAETAGFCPGYFSEVFHRSLGCTYTEYMTELKLSCAARLLENRDITSTDLCFECGFTSVSNFLKAFKAHFGVSPQKYAEEYKKGI